MLPSQCGFKKVVLDLSSGDIGFMYEEVLPLQSHVTLGPIALSV